MSSTGIFGPLLAGDGATAPGVRRRALVLLNESARGVAANAGVALEILKRLGFDVVRVDVPERRSAMATLSKYSEHIDLVIAGGGDGTLNIVLQGLVGSKLPLGILPLGTANDLAKSLGISNSLEDACAVIARGRTRRIDVGRVNDVYFFSEASIGMSVRVCRALTKDAKATFGVFSLLYHAFRIVLEMRRFRALVTLPSGEKVALRTAQLTIGNSRNFGGFFVSDEAAIDDRELDLYSVELEHWWNYFEAVAALLRRRYDDVRMVFTRHGKRFEVKTGRPMRIEADGEFVSSTPATYVIVPSAVEVFVPDAAHAHETA